MFITSWKKRGQHTWSNVCFIHTEALTVLAVPCFTVLECCKDSCCCIEEVIYCKFMMVTSKTDLNGVHFGFVAMSLL